MRQQKLVEFCNKVSGVKNNSKKSVKYDDPRFLLLEKIVTEEMAEVALYLEYRQHQTASEIAQKANKEESYISEQLWKLADVGVATVKKEEHGDTFWYETWVPGIFEMVVNHKENVSKYPQIAKAFDDWGRNRNPMAAGNFPIGKGVMRVIPIESAIDGSTKAVDFEHVSMFIENNSVFSVSDCSCRTSREEMGEGCGHLKENMCIQLGDAAEYYIRTGRGRKIEKDEVYEIIKKAEENGLMHHIPNTEGPHHTHAICNCCGCGCYAIRAANMYHNPDMVRSNYVSKVDKETCVGCGECIQVCPTNALKLGQKLCTITEIDIPKRTEFPNDTKWGPDKWNPDYRDNRKDSLDTGTSPCKTSCPSHVSIPAYIKLASQGRYKEALELIKKDNPFPAVCGRICPAVCEDACTRGNVDEAIAIDDIKKFIAEQDLKSEHRYIPTVKHDYTDKHIAVIGAGPSGLSCAYYLAVEGYQVTVFEKKKELGGMLTYGIPNFRLDHNVIQSEIDVLKELGVTFKTSINVGTDVTFEELRSEGYNAFYVAIGAQKGRWIGLENEDTTNIYTGIEFLQQVKDQNITSLTGKVVVIGGGNVAIDVARTAKRIATDTVSIVSLETRDEMPALEEEIAEALEENIEIINGYGPKKYVVDGKNAVGVEFHKCIQTKDAQGRFNPVFDEADHFIAEADYIILAVGQTIDLGSLFDQEDVMINPNNTIQVDPFTLQSAVSDIFAGGDVVTGPKYAIDAIALGKEASISIHRFVQRGQSLTYGRSRNNYIALDKDNVDYSSYDKSPRSKPHCTESNHNLSFQDNRGILTEEQVQQETSRCMGCGITTVDEFLCVGCGACTTRCKFDAISLDRVYNEEGVDFPELKPIIVKHALKRKVKIAVKSVNQSLFKRGQ